MSSQAVYSAVRCESLLHKIPDDQLQKVETTTNLKQIRDILDLNKLKENQFSLDAQDNLYDVSGQQPIFLGPVVIRHPKYLYQWASREERKVQIKNKGILKSEMKNILEAESQSYGKGFYVSTNPFDSQNYGDAVTVFKAQGPMVFVQYVHKSAIRNLSTEALQRLVKVGIDAFQANNSFDRTWLSVITTKHLKTIESTEIIDDPAWNDFNNVDKLLKVEHKMKISNLWKNIPEDNFFKKFQFKNIEFPIELNAKNLQFLASTLYGNNYSGHKLGIYIRNVLKKYLSEIDYLKTDLPGITKNLELFRRFNIQFEKPINQGAPSDVLEFIDLHSLDKLAQNEKIPLASSFAEAMNLGKKMLDERSKVNLSRINSAQTFISELKQSLGDNLILRDHDVRVLPPDGKPMPPLDGMQLLQARENQLLTLKTYEYKTISNRRYMEAHVDYATLSKLIQLAPNLPIKLELKKHLELNKENILNAPQSLESKQTYQHLLENVLELFFTPEGQKLILEITQGKKASDNSAIRAIQLYSSFMSLHPFNVGNVRAGRLYYEYITAQINGGKSQKLLLPNSHLDFLNGSYNSLELSRAAIYMQFKLSQARTVEEFQELVKKTYSAYKIAYRDLFQENI